MEKTRGSAYDKEAQLGSALLQPLLEPSPHISPSSLLSLHKYRERLLSVTARRGGRLAAAAIGLVLCLGTYLSWTSTPLPVSFPSTHPPSPPFPHLPGEYAPYFPNSTLPASLLSDASIYANADLAGRLHAFLSRPLLSYPHAAQVNINRSAEYGAEGACPLDIADRMVNPEQFQAEDGFWRSVSLDEVVKRRVEIVEWVQEWLGRNGEMSPRDARVAPMWGEGKGIVMTAGNGDTTKRALTCLKMIRSYGCTLPVEIFHFASELRDAAERAAFEELGATLRTSGDDEMAGVYKNWQIKGLALVQCSFREFLYLDSDVIPLRSPSHLFTSPTYLQHGAVFWPDLSKDHPNNAIWRIVGEPCTLREWTFESGQMVIDKSANGGLNLIALVIAAQMQREPGFWFRLCGGDKDTFRWAWRMLGLEYGVPERFMSEAGFLGDERGSKWFCGHSVIQYDLDPHPRSSTGAVAPLFVHGNLLKTVNTGGREGAALYPILRHFRNDTFFAPHLNYARVIAHGTPSGWCTDMMWDDSAKDHFNAAQRASLGVEDINLSPGQASDLDDTGAQGDLDDEQVTQLVFEGFAQRWWDVWTAVQ